MNATKQYSGKQVNAAGDYLSTPNNPSDGDRFDHAMDVLSYWRQCHEAPLVEALRVVESEAKKIDRSFFSAKRLKRQESIVLKLSRYDGMKLKNMQDIGGCRVVLSSLKKVEKLIRSLKTRSEFRFEDNTLKQKDYIKNPKNDGYRSVHLVGKFKDQKGIDRNIEVQIRTRLQHDWATALEIVDLFTGQRLKQNQGKAEWSEFFKKISDLFSEMEKTPSFKPERLESREVFYQKIIDSESKITTLVEAKRLSDKLDVVDKFNAFAQSIKFADGRQQESKIEGYALIRVDTEVRQIQTWIFDKAKSEEAETSYTELEKETIKNKKIVVALVSTTAIGGLREAFPNYFADSSEFLKHLLVITNAPINRDGLSAAQKIIEWIRGIGR